MATETDKNARAREQAEAQYESICTMVDRYEHAAECDGELEVEGGNCELTDAEIFAGLQLFHQGETATEEQRQQYHDEDKARQIIEEDPLSVEVRSGWHAQGEEAEDEEFTILLCTGGPAVRIRGELNQYGEADRAWLEFQDWFTAWEEYIPARSAVLCQYANFFLGL